MFRSSKTTRGSRRRLTLGLTTAMLFAAMAVAAVAGHWPQFGGDAGRSGNQPVEQTGPPITKKYAKVDDKAIVTSVITSAGGDATVRRMVYGTEGSGGGFNGNVHIQKLSDGTPIGPEAGVDVEDGVDDVDTFRGRAADAGAASRNPAPPGSVTPVDTSTASALGQVVALHNDDNQDDGATAATGEQDPRTGNDIAMALIDEATGNLIFDKEVGSENVGNTSDTGFNPLEPNTVNYTLSSAPLLLAPASDGSRELYFLAERTATFTDTAPLEGFPCRPATSFEQPPAGGPATRGCDVSFRTTLFKVKISNALTTSANFSPDDISWVDVKTGDTQSGNPLASPTLVNIDGAPHIGVSTTTGEMHLYKAADIDPVDPATPAPAYRVTGLGVQVQTPSVPVTSTGALPNPAPAIFVAGNLARANSSAPVSRVHRIERDPADATKLKVTQSSPTLQGEAAPALAVSSVASPTGGTFSGGRVLYTTARNLYSLQPDDLSRGSSLDIGNALVGGTTGFSRTTAAVSGGVAYVQRDNGQHLARDQRSLDPVEFDAYGEPDNVQTANDGIGQPSIASRLIQFGNADGAFVYQAAPFVPTPGSVGISIGDVTVKEGDTGTSVATFTLTKTGTSGGSVTVQTADGTAKAGEDYVAAGPTVVTFGESETTKTFDVTINGDTTFESDEFFKLQLTNPTAGVVIGDSEGSGIIQNDDPAPQGESKSDAVLIVSDQVVTEGDFSDVLAVFSVGLTSPAKEPVTVRYGTASRTAVGGSDFTSTSGTLTFAPGEQVKQFAVPVKPDGLVESTEQFFVGIADATGAAIADPVGVGTIVDDDGAPAAPFAKAPTINLTVTPKRDRKKPFRFTSTGRLRIPAGVSQTKGCQGRVEVQVKVVRKTISTRRANVQSDCRYRLRVTFKDAKRFSKSGVLSFRARYQGTPFLKAAKSKEIKVRTTR